jgi:DNA repair photolyase
MIREIQVKSILNKHKKRDSWFLDDYSVNPYSGCSFNCIYCYTRGSKYGSNLAEGLSLKVNAPDLLEKELSRRAEKKQYGIILFASQEAYIPIEKKYKLTRRLLEIVLKHKFPVHVVTKSTLVLRDLDILKEIDKMAILPNDLKPKLKQGVIISSSISTLDEKLAKIFEPGAPTPRQRLETMRDCKRKGFLIGMNFMPLLPYLSDSDTQLEEMVKTAKDYDMDFVLAGGLTLFGKEPTDCKVLYYKILERHFSELVPKYKSLFRIFFAPPKEYQERLESRAKELCGRYKIAYGIIKR